MSDPLPRDLRIFMVAAYSLHMVLELDGLMVSLAHARIIATNCSTKNTYGYSFLSMVSASDGLLVRHAHV